MIQKDSRLFMHTATISMRQKSNTQKRGRKYFSAVVCLIIHCCEAHCTYKDHECALACIADKAQLHVLHWLLVMFFQPRPIHADDVIQEELYPFRYTISCLQVMGIARYLSIHHASLLLTIMKVVASKSNRLQGIMNEMNTQKSQTQTQYFTSQDILRS